LLVRVAKGTTDGFWEANLLAWFKEVLTGENVIWSKLTEILLRRDFTWQQRRREAGARLHFAANAGFRGWTDGIDAADHGVFLILDTVGGTVVHDHEVDNGRDGEGDERLAGRDLFHLHLHLLYIETIFLFIVFNHIVIWVRLDFWFWFWDNLGFWLWFWSWLWNWVDLHLNEVPRWTKRLLREPKTRVFKHD